MAKHYCRWTAQNRTKCKCGKIRCCSEWYRGHGWSNQTARCKMPAMKNSKHCERHQPAPMPVDETLEQIIGAFKI